MPLEIERRFLVRSEAWRPLVARELAITQAYLATRDKATVRVRIRDDAHAWLTIKSQGEGAVRSEYEYAIPVDDAREMLDLRVGAVLEKVRHVVPHQGLSWEIDVFSGDNSGLVIAEVELTSSTQDVALPQWVGREITGDVRYANSSLAERPYSTFGGDTPSRG